MTIKEAIEYGKEWNKAIESRGDTPFSEARQFLNLAIKALDSQWIPIKTRELTEEEKEEYPDCTFMYDCKLPEDGEEVLVTTWSGEVALDTFCRDDGCYFEYGCDEGDVIAWMPKPEPYKAEVIGHWKEHYYPHFDVPGIECSICGAVVESWVSYMPKPDTCPNCHSKMEVEK